MCLCRFNVVAFMFLTLLSTHHVAEGDESLKELQRLPAGASIVLQANSLEELKGKEDVLSTVNVVRSLS